MPATVRNAAREKLDQGQLSLGVGVRMTRSVEIAKAMAVAGFDWLFLDMEHGVMSLEACAQISTAALDAGIAPIARVPNGEYAIATRALDNGALGIVMPHVDTAAEARAVVNRLKYPPVGHRSMGGIGPHYGLRSASSGEAASALNAANLTVVMLETPTAIANADEIAAVPGVDVLLIGTNDLCAEMGIHGDFGNERVADAYRAMIAAARKHGKFPGIAGVYNETIMPRYIEMGARFILSGQDAAFMAAGAAQLAVNTGGDQADEVIQRMPDSKPLVRVHAEWGEQMRTVAVSAAISAVVALAFYRLARFRRILAFVTTMIAAAACYCAIEAAAHGGAMVFHHGVGVQVAPNGSGAGIVPASPTPVPTTTATPSG